MPVPPDQTQRQLAIERLNLLIYRSDETLARITRLLGRAMGSPFAAFSVLAKTGQEYVATYGFEAETMPWQDTLCSVTTLDESLLNVADTLDHEDYAQLPVVTQPEGTRFYVGVPIRSPDNWIIGVLCIFGPEPRELTRAELEDVNDYGRLIEEALSMRVAAIKDELTGLYNRRYLTEQMDREWRRAMRMLLPISFVMFDLDHFKQYNDCQGHVAGDDVLRRVAAVLQKHIRRAGDTMARFGGEEFVAVLPATTLDETRILVEKVRQEIRALDIEHPSCEEGYITISAGIATAKNTDEFQCGGPDYFLTRADRALYQAKHDGRNCIRVYEDIG